MTALRLLPYVSWQYLETEPIPDSPQKKQGDGALPHLPILLAPT
jgi:hypothetical protein